MNIGVMGYGLIGKERVNALLRLRLDGYPVENIGVYDPNILGHSDAGYIFYNTKEEFLSEQWDWIVIATPHTVATQLLKEIIPTGQKILVEKPFCISYKEAKEIYSICAENQLFVGFNYRFFSGVSQLIEDIRDDIFGKIISINMILGHGGNPKDSNSWKMNKSQVGSGVLLDPGIHMLDILTLMLNEVVPLSGYSWRGFWNSGIDEEINLNLGTFESMINLQVSLVKWRSTFRIEVNGDEGYGIVEGRGKSYGEQTYLIGDKWGYQSGTSQRESEEVVLASDCSDSFYRELRSLLFNRGGDYLKPCSAKEALKVMELYEECLEVII